MIADFVSLAGGTNPVEPLCIATDGATADCDNFNPMLPSAQPMFWLTMVCILYALVWCLNVTVFRSCGAEAKRDRARRCAAKELRSMLRSITKRSFRPDFTPGHAGVCDSSLVHEDAPASPLTDMVRRHLETYGCRGAEDGS